ncbi:hypothetical protein H6P81_001473 [Aristolochia fimbriata]|uniref:Uncharacterized protein n=1 Tax=Aristolochia fimbriata TaxID=158543 RepID=A0AAV7F701_ARIFI|nr:hypothetical protein H6P81_001473 [Aristolochia fimbriata]
MLQRLLKSSFTEEKLVMCITLGQRRRGESLMCKRYLPTCFLRPGDQRYFLDDEKLKNLRWSERTIWEEGVKKTNEWYTNNPDTWGDVSGALLPHPRMLMMPGIERQFDGSEDSSAAAAPRAVSSGRQDRMVVPSPKSSSSSPKLSYKFLIYGRTGWIGGLLGKLCERQGISYEYAKGHLEERSQLVADITNVKPTHVFNGAGVTGRPNVDWFCSSHVNNTPWYSIFSSEIQTDKRSVTSNLYVHPESRKGFSYVHSFTRSLEIEQTDVRSEVTEYIT